VANTTRIEAVYKEIGRRIEFLRTDRGFSQRELGERLRHPLTRAAVCNMEGGRQRILGHVLLEIADALDVDPRELLPGQRRADAAAALNTTMQEQLAAAGLHPDVAASLAKRLSTGADEP
jgi:transcriptional regulator with XRE-family HTH domain